MTLTWPGLLRGVPAFFARRNPAVLDARRECAKKMLLAVGQLPSDGPTLTDVTAALGDVTHLNVEAFAPLLIGLGKNRGALGEFLGCVWDGDLQLQRTANQWDGNALVMAAGPNWFIRLAGWDPTTPPEPFLHTHTFALLTHGVVGPGYVTEVYHVHREQLAASYVGQRVVMAGPQHLQLHEGRTLFYPAHQLAHRQFAPERYSISLNLIIDASMVPPFRQFFIDPATRTRMA